MQENLAIMLPEAMQHVLAQGGQLTGPPLVRYHKWGDPLDLEACIPVSGPIEAGGRVQSKKLPAGPAVVGWHVGPYEQLGVTHEKIGAYVNEHGLEPQGAPWEEYWSDPGLEPDSSKWRTRIVWPITHREE